MLVRPAAAALLLLVATPALADGETPALADGETSALADGETSALADGETSALADGETSGGSRPRIGLVLGGGGARGGAHVGVLLALEELGVPVDAVAGTSIGAIVGGLYVTGVPPEDIRLQLTSLDWADAFRDVPPRRERSFRRKSDDEGLVRPAQLGIGPEGFELAPSLRQGEKLRLLLEQALGSATSVQDFDELAIPFRAVASDLATAETVVLANGSLAEAVRASAAIPGFLPPVERDGRLLVDGGVTNNLPVDVARALGVDVILAVDVSTPLLERAALRTALDTTLQLTNILVHANSEPQRAALLAFPHGVLVRPELGDLGATDFDRLDQAVALGRAAVLRIAEQLRPLTLSPEAHAAWRRRVFGQPALLPAPLVAELEIDTDTRLSTRAIRARIRQRVGEPLDEQRLHEDLTRLHGLGWLAHASYRVKPGPEGAILTVQVRRKRSGGDYVQLGLGLAADIAGRQTFQIGAAYTQPDLNALGGEWRADLRIGGDSLLGVDLHQPLDRRGRWFVNPRAWYEIRSLPLWDDEDQELAELRFRQGGLALAGGAELGRLGEIRLGVQRRWGEADTLTGEVDVPHSVLRGGSASLRLSADTLDDVAFPQDGVRGRLEWTRARTALGARPDEEYDRVDAEIIAARAWGRSSIVLGGWLARTVDGTLPLEDQPTLGGFLQLSGLPEDRLHGQHVALARLAYFRRFGSGTGVAWRWGLSLEAGNTWDDPDDADFDTLVPAGSVFLGVDTPLGPVYLGAGLAEEGQASAYLFLGRVF